MNTKNGTTNGSHKHLLNLWQRLHLRSSDKHAALLYYTKKNIRKQYKNTKLTKIIAPTWDDECELPDGSYSASDIQDYIEYIIKTHEILTTIPPIYVYINRINNGLVFKIKNGYKLELQSFKMMRLLGSTKKIRDKKQRRKSIKTWSSWRSFTSVDSQYQQKSEVLYTFTSNKSHAYLLNVEPSNLVFLKT